MKYAILPILFIIHTIVFAQQPPVLAEYIYYGKSGENWVSQGKETFRHNEFGRLIEKVETKLIDGVWSEHSKKAYQYPSAIQRIESTTMRSEEKLEIFREIYTVDDQGRDIAMTSEDYDPASESWIPSVRGEARFEQNGAVLIMTYQRLKNDEWVDEDRTISRYDASDNLLEEELQTWENGSWVSKQKQVNLYNDKQKIVFTEYFKVDKSSATPVMQTQSDTRFLFTYDMQGNMIDRIVQQRINGEWQEVFKRHSIFK